MPTHPMIEQLIHAQLDFFDQEFAQAETIQLEFQTFYHWLCSQQLQQLWSFEQIFQLLEKQILATAASPFLLEQITEHLNFALIHPLNDQTTIEDVIPVVTIDTIAQYIASKSEHRQRMIHSIVHSPAFSALIIRLTQHSIQDYLDHSMMSKRVPGVGQFMKMGKSVFETVTDSKIDETIAHYLEKNIIKISQMSERVLNQYFNNDKLYHLQASLWHKIKVMPLSVLRQYIEVQDLPQTVAMGHALWDYLRQTPYLKQQLHDGIYTWYARNQERTFKQLLQDINIDEALIQQELSTLLIPVLQQLIYTGHFRQRAKIYLEKFYYSEQTLQILKQQG